MAEQSAAHDLPLREKAAKTLSLSLPFSLSLSLSLLFEKKNFFIPAFDIRRNTTFPEISELARVGRFNSVVGGLGIGINILLL